MPQFSIEPNRDTGGRKVEIDGVDISHAVSGVTVDLGLVGDRVTLHLAYAQGVGRLGLDDVEFHIPTTTRAVLHDLGWTPPAENPEGPYIFRRIE